jgi:hypothetical protein
MILALKCAFTVRKVTEKASQMFEKAFPTMNCRKAGNGNRTRMASLEGWNFTIKLCPRFVRAEKMP